MNIKIAAFVFFLFQLWDPNNEFDAKAKDNLLSVLGAKTGSREFKTFKEFWNIDRNFESRKEGVKLYVNSITEEVESVFIAGENSPMNQLGFQKFSSVLPFGIDWEDDTASLTKKLDEGQKIIGKNALKFYRGNMAVEISFTDLRVGKISTMKFYKEVKRISLPAVTAGEMKKETTTVVRMREELKQFEKRPVTITKPIILDTTLLSASPFKRAILDVFKSYHESNFYSIKTDMRTIRNFWNYKFTYSTKLKIPGEKFNMLYCFPFINSPLDFVSVIKETESYDKSLEIAYKSFEKKLLENFSEKDGWVATCIANKESKKLSDLEFRNDKYGAVILDYSKNPNGRHVVYLRFLLFSS